MNEDEEATEAEAVDYEYYIPSAELKAIAARASARKIEKQQPPSMEEPEPTPIKAPALISKEVFLIAKRAGECLAIAFDLICR